jgi:predicted transcriptional regulator
VGENMIKRSEDAINKAILKSIGELGVALNRPIMERANLSTVQCRRYLQGLLHQRLIKQHILIGRGLRTKTFHRAYTLTFKGFEEVSK